MRHSYHDPGYPFLMFILWPILMILVAVLGRFCVDYILTTVFADATFWTTLPYLVQLVIGLLASKVALPGAVITWILTHFTTMPLF